MAMTIDSTRTMTATAAVAPQQAAKAPQPTKLDQTISNLGRSDSFLSVAKRSAVHGAAAGARAGAIMGAFAGMRQGMGGVVLGGLGGGLIGGLSGGAIATVAAPAAKAVSNTHRANVAAAIGGVALGAASLIAFRNGSAVVPGLIVGAVASYAAAKR